MANRLSVLVVTDLFPNSLEPGRAPFNRIQFQALREFADVDIAGVTARQPGRNLVFGKKLPRSESIAGFDVTHPPYLSLPGFPGLNATSLFLCSQNSLGKRLNEGDYDVVLGAYAYPEGLGALLLAKQRGLPVVIKCHGSDLNRAPKHRSVYAQLRFLMPRASAVVVVSNALGQTAEEFGVSSEKIHTVYNGVDKALFKPTRKKDAQGKIGLAPDKKRVFFVGHLSENKGVLDLVRAAELCVDPSVEFVFAGEGPLLDRLRAHALASTGAIRVLGRLTHDELSSWMSACELLALPSFSEGMPNVVREAHAAGRPVVATRVGGIPEAVCRPELGSLVEPGQPASLWAAIRHVLDTESQLKPEARAQMAEVPTWPESAQQLAQVLADVC